MHRQLACYVFIYFIQFVILLLLLYIVSAVKPQVAAPPADSPAAAVRGESRVTHVDLSYLCVFSSHIGKGSVKNSRLVRCFFCVQVKMNRMRLRIAQRLKEAQNTCAMLTTFNEVDMR